VRQGCVLAPSLFCRAVDWVLKESLHHSGVTVSDEQISDINYADDIAVVDENQLNLTNTLERMKGACSALALHISWTKTKIQNIRDGACPAVVVVGGQTAEGVQDFTYLRSQISLTVGSRTEQQQRTGIASGTMQCLDRIWCQQPLSLLTKLRLYTTLVLQVLLYASGTWTVTKLDLAHLQALSHEVPETHHKRALVGSCHQQGNSQTYLSTAHRTTYGQESLAKASMPFVVLVASGMPHAFLF